MNRDKALLVACALAVALVPASARAQTTGTTGTGVERGVQRLSTTPVGNEQVTKTSQARPPVRGLGTLTGVLIGGGLGAAFGEQAFGQGMDMPHGLDMMLGAALGATLGGFIGAGIDSQGSHSPMVVPVLWVSKTTALAGMKIALRRR